MVCVEEECADWEETGVEGGVEGRGGEVSRRRVSVSPGGVVEGEEGGDTKGDGPSWC